jgi:hypothetical protein
MVMAEKQRRQIECSEALNKHGIFTNHEEMDNGQYRFRLVSKDGSAYIRTEAKGHPDWQSSHHHEIKETYIVQAGWMALARWRNDQLQIEMYGPDERFATEPIEVHNVYLSTKAIIHTIKHGVAKDPRWHPDPDFDKKTQHLTEKKIYRLALKKLKI